MTPTIDAEGVRVFWGDSVDVLAGLPPESVDAVVCDPPYGLGAPPPIEEVMRAWLAGERYTPRGRGFMGLEWDAFVPGPEVWRECFRVLKPGGHLLAFFGTRTADIGGLAIRLAGFDIRDTIAWMYGSGFPKSLDVSKAIDRRRHEQDEIREVTAWIAAARSAAGVTNRDIDEAFGFNGMAGHWTTQGSQPAVPTLEQVPRLLDVLRVTDDDVPANIRRLLFEQNGSKYQPGAAWFDREVVGTKVGRSTPFGGHSQEFTVSLPAKGAAKQWDGWGTALKPAFEPVIVARRPLVGTVAANVLEHGTGGINIDACRIGDEIRFNPPTRKDATSSLGSFANCAGVGSEVSGRWPANVALDETAAEHLGEKSRYFYCPKAGKRERQGSSHPTVKPLELMRWLVRMVTPPGGTVLDPFAGTGTTLEAARLEGFNAIGVEREEEYLTDIARRLGVPEGLLAPPKTWFAGGGRVEEYTP